jgi:hypothetical protein
VPNDAQNHQKGLSIGSGGGAKVSSFERQYRLLAEQFINNVNQNVTTNDSVSNQKTANMQILLLTDRDLKKYNERTERRYS